VVGLIDTTTVTLGGKDCPTLVFEYVPGGNLHKRIAESQQPNADVTSALLIGLLRGVKDLHRAAGTEKLLISDAERSRNRSPVETWYCQSNPRGKEMTLRCDLDASVILRETRDPRP
jgi:hypothetical protein